MRVIYCERQKELKKIVLHLKSTLARPPFHDEAYHLKPSTASPGIPASVMKPSLLLFFVQSDEKKLEETNFLKIFGKKSLKQVLRSRNFHENPLLNKCLICSAIQVICITLRVTLSALTFRKCRNLFENFFSAKTFLKTEKIRLKSECKQRFILHRLTSIGMPYMGY